MAAGIEFIRVLERLYDVVSTLVTYCHDELVEQFVDLVGDIRNLLRRIELLEEQVGVEGNHAAA